MDELFAILAVLAVVLTIITVVGHGLWLLAAAIVRAFSPSRAEKRGSEGRAADSPSTPPGGNSTADEPPAELRGGLGGDPARCPHCGGVIGLSQSLAADRAGADASAQASGVAPARPSGQAEPVSAELVREPRAPSREAEKAPWHQAAAEYFDARDIHWAEPLGALVGGLMMVGSSIALVISLWQQLENVPHLKLAIFVAYSSLVFGAGLYARHRWQLRSTGDGLLTIATLLVPLNFLAMVGLWRGDLEPLTLLSELAALAVFVVLLWLAGATLVPRGRWHLALGTAGGSALVLLGARLGGGWLPIEWLAVGGLLPALLPAGVIGAYLLPMSAWWGGKRSAADSRPTADGAWSRRRALGLLTLLGSVTFAAAVAVGVYGVEAGARLKHLEPLLGGLAASVTLLAIPSLACGTVLVERTRDAAALTTVRTVGTAVVTLAAAVQVLALVVAWPDATWVTVVALTAAAGCLATARFSPTLGPTLFAAGQALTYVAAVTVAMLVTGVEEDNRLAPWAMQSYGIALALVSLAWGVVGERFARGIAGRRQVSFAVVTCVAGLNLLAVAGWMLPELARELTRFPVGTTLAAHAGSVISWYLLGALAAAVWVPWRNTPARVRSATTILLAAAVPWMLASYFTEELAAASALRWTAALCYALVTAALLAGPRLGLRERLEHWRAAARTGGDACSARRSTDESISPASLARWLAVGLIAAPVLLLTLVAAGLQCVGVASRGPAAGTLLGELGPALNYCLPLAVVMAALVGHVMRHRSALTIVAAEAYTLALVAEVFVLTVRGLPPVQWIWTLAPELAGVMLTAACVAWALPRLDRRWGLWHRLGIPRPAAVGNARWFHVAQATAGLLVAGLVLWITLDVGIDGLGADVALFGLSGRLAGPPSALMLLGTTIVMASLGRGREASDSDGFRPDAAGSDRLFASFWRQSALVAGLLLNCAVGWATLSVAPGTLGHQAGLMKMLSSGQFGRNMY